MAQITLFITPLDVIERTTFDGNIDEDNLNPTIWLAQSTYLKSFLGLDLYNKIYNDFVDDTLEGQYIILFEDYIKDILAFQTAKLFIDVGGAKISENGIHKITPEKTEVLSESESNRLSLLYGSLIANVEANFKEYVDTVVIAELHDKSILTDNLFPWH